MDLIPIERLGASSQKTNILGELAQILIYSRPFGVWVILRCKNFDLLFFLSLLFFFKLWVLWVR